MKGSELPVPEWFTAEFLYRINYGPVEPGDYETALTYSRDRIYSREAARRRQAYPYRQSVKRWGWTPRFPWFRGPIRNTMEIWDDDRRYRRGGIWKQGTEPWVVSRNSQLGPHRVYLKFLDPRLSEVFFQNLLPYCSPRLPGGDSFLYWEYNEDLLLLEFEYNLLRRLRPLSQYGLTNRMPLAAMLADANTLISIVSKLTDRPLRINWREIQETHPNTFYGARSQLVHGEPTPMFHFGDSGFCKTFLDLILFGSSELGIGPWKQLPGNQFYEIDPPKTWFRLAGFSEQEDNARTVLKKKLDDLKLDFSNIDASFICSGPFRLMLTTRLERHFILDRDGYLQIFWDFRSLPGSSFVSRFETHFLWGKSENDGCSKNIRLFRLPSVLTRVANIRVWHRKSGVPILSCSVARPSPKESGCNFMAPQLGSTASIMVVSRSI
jgi:hypothetical protein